jgi:hypothetical protein
MIEIADVIRSETDVSEIWYNGEYAGPCSDERDGAEDIVSRL